MDLLQSSWWILFLVFTLSQPCLCAQDERKNLPKLGGKVYAVDPCELECDCYGWKSVDEAGGVESRFTVNCSGLNFGRQEGSDIPVFLPFNTTDLFVSAYRLGMIDIGTFPNIVSPFPSKTYRLTPKFLTISLNNCRINYLTSEAFYAASVRSSVRGIDLSHNYIEVVQQRLFWQFPLLQNISMPYNFIRTVEKEAFKELPKTLAINLSHNLLQEIHPESFADIPHLEILDLSHNLLTSIPLEIISQLPSLKYLGLKGHFWNCSCEMTSRIFNVNYSLIGGTEVKCRYPEALKGTPLKLLTPEHFHHCQANVYVTNNSYYIYMYTGIITFVVIYTIHSLFPHSGQNIIGQIEFDPKIKLGEKVFKGRLKDGRCTAIKVCSCLSKENFKELKVFLSLSEKGPPHPNIIQYMCTEEDLMATYLALELCDGNLKTAVVDYHKEFRPYLKPENCLSQLICGLSFLHKHGIQHRDIKPSNILWKKSEGSIRFIISDFDWGHFSEDQSSHKAMYGTLGWTAPELWNLAERTSAVDVFSLGCVFYFVLTIGGHPFGSMDDMETCQKNITSEKYHCTLINALEVHWMPFPQVPYLADDLISKMIHKIPQERPDASDITNHPLLWDTAKVVSFFHKIGDCMEDKTDSKIAAFKEMLESQATVVFEGSWMDKLDKVVRSDIEGFKKQQRQLCGILRVIRNKEQHFGKLRSELRKIYFDRKEGVVQYYNGLFPRLLVYTYRTLIKSGLNFKNGCIC